MNNQNPHETNQKQQLLDDLQYMRLAIERTRRDFDPGTVGMIAWGLASLIGYWATYFLATPQYYKLILPIWIVVLSTAFIVNFFSGAKIRKKEMKLGCIPKLSTQIDWIWAIVVLHGIIWSILGLFNVSGGPGFLWALLYSIALSATGILHSKVWLWGGLGILSGMIAAYFVQDYAYLILGFVMCMGCIVPAVLAERDYLARNKQNV